MAESLIANTSRQIWRVSAPSTGAARSSGSGIESKSAGPLVRDCAAGSAPGRPTTDETVLKRLYRHCSKLLRLPAGTAKHPGRSDGVSVETMADIASEVGLSVRALEDGFLRYVGTPPMSYFRQVRMSWAHDDLVSADPRRHDGHNHRAALGDWDTTGGSPPSIGAPAAASHSRHCGPADLCRPLRARGRTAPNTTIRAVCCRLRTTVAQRSGCIVHRMTRRQREVEDRVVRPVESPRAGWGRRKPPAALKVEPLRPTRRVSRGPPVSRPLSAVGRPGTAGRGRGPESLCMSD
jgi:AraC-like DNA-binding protein